MVFQLGYTDTNYLKRCVISMAQENIFKWKHLTSQIFILLTVRLVPTVQLSLRDLVELRKKEDYS